MDCKSHYPHSIIENENSATLSFTAEKNGCNQYIDIYDNYSDFVNYSLIAVCSFLGSK